MITYPCLLWVIWWRRDSVLDYPCLPWVIWWRRDSVLDYTWLPWLIYWRDSVLDYPCLPWVIWWRRDSVLDCLFVFAISILRENPVNFEWIRNYPPPTNTFYGKQKSFFFSAIFLHYQFLVMHQPCLY